MELTPKITSSQTVAAILICRIFTLLIAVPNNKYTLEGSGILLIPLFSIALSVLVMIPLFFLMKTNPQQDLPQCAASIAPALYKPLTLWCYTLCTLAAVGTVSQSEYFITTSLYPRARRWSVVLLFIPVVWYLVTLGIESLSRVSVIVCALIAVSFGLICVGAASKIDLMPLGDPLYDGWKQIGRTALGFWGQNLELLLFSLIQPYTRKNTVKKDFGFFLTAAAFCGEVVYFFTYTVLGDYGKTRMFPVYTLSSVSGSHFFSRLDYLHVVNWIFICLVRCALYTYFGSVLLGNLIPALRGWKARVLNILLILGVALAVTNTNRSFQKFYRIFGSGIPVMVTLTVIPTILLAVRQWKIWKGGKQSAKV